MSSPKNTMKSNETPDDKYPQISRNDTNLTIETEYI